MISKINWPDGLDDQGFLDQYWQKRPLLIRQAYPDFETPLPADELAGLSLEEDTSPRLIVQNDNGHYQLEHGPFNADRFTTLTGNNWSLLVTDVEKHLPDLAMYLAPFQFLPSWRIDDLMISYAPEGASVGAHIDEYDVFLLQASGVRQWMIDTSDKPNTTLDSNTSLKILESFSPTDTWNLSPGDLLYLPPGVPHHGVAASEDCTTWSVGFRAPTRDTIVYSFAENLNLAKADERYRDPPLTPGPTGLIDDQSLSQFRQVWREATNLSDAELNQLTGRMLTAPVTDLNQTDVDTATLVSTRWRRNPFSRAAYVEENESVTLFIDGMALSCSLLFAQTICADGIVQHNKDLSDTDANLLETLVQHGCLIADD